MIDNIRAIAELARDKHGVRATTLPYAGGYIEFADEMEYLAEDIPAEVAGLCLDSGHFAYAGLGPLEALRRHWERVDYTHFKDIDPMVFNRMMGERIRFFGRLCARSDTPIGRANLDCPAIRALLAELGRGYITIEQGRDDERGLRPWRPRRDRVLTETAPARYVPGSPFTPASSGIPGTRRRRSARRVPGQGRRRWRRRP